MIKIWIGLASISGFLAVAIGAFGAHALKDRLDAYHLGVFETGNRYHFFHALALLAVGILAERSPGTPWTVAGWSFVVGTLLFSGSLYALALSGVKVLGAITPLGGLAFLIGWAAMAYAAFR